MKNLKFIITAILLVAANLTAVSAAPKDKSIDFGNVDKKVEGWKYLLNGKEVSYLPEIYLAGNAKYVPIDLVKNHGVILVFDSKNRTAYLTNNDQSFIIKENSKQIFVNNKNFLISEEPVWKNNTLYVSTKFLSVLGILVSENKYENELNIIKNYNIINSLKTNIDNTENKVTFSLNTLPVYDTEAGTNFYRLTMFGTTVLEPDTFKKQLENLSTDFKKVDLDVSKQGLVIITFNTKGELGTVNTYNLEAPERLVIQFPKIYRDEYKEMVSSSLARTKIAEGTFQGPLRINLLEVKPNRDLLIKPVVSRDDKQNFTLREVSRFGKDFNAVAGINGGYFSTATKFPLGLVYLNGELVSAPIYNRSALILNKDNTFSVKNVDLNIFLNAYDIEGVPRPIKINAYNLPPQKNQLVLFTYNYGKDNLNKKPKPEKAEEVKIEEAELNNEEIKKTEPEAPEFVGYLVPKNGGRLIKLNDFNGSIPAGNYVLYASGTAKNELEKSMQNSTRYNLSFNYSQPLNTAVFALGGGLTLVRDGSLINTALEEKFKPDIAEGKAPRTAVAILKNGRLLMAAVDGRSESSKGMTLDELGAFLKQYDAREAVNFDGGGSTAMYLNGQIINTVSDPKERKVSTTLMIFREKK